MTKPHTDWITPVLTGDRDAMRSTFPWADAMAVCPQDALYHAEGEVWIHTMMVLSGVEARIPALADDPNDVMRLAALFHDSAKPETTKIEFCETEQRERVKQPNHAKKGADKAWQWLVDAGMSVPLAREVSSLVLWHQRPSHIHEQKNQATRIARFVAEGGRWDRLFALCQSDQNGRISPNVADGLLALEMLELDVLALSDNLGYDLMRGEAPDSGEWRYRIGEDWKADPFYAPEDASGKRLTVMSGLPGSGKSTWVKENAGDALVVSLDAIRAEFKRYKRNQEFEGRCFQEATARLRQGLAAGRDVIWDACGLDARSRAKPLRIGRDYGALLRVVSVDEPFEVCAARNADREYPVPNDVMAEMAAGREMVLATEGHEVWSVRDGLRLDVSRRPELAEDAPRPE